VFLNGIRLMALIRARAHLQGYKRSYSSTALVDTGARMTLIDRLLAEEIGVECTGRILSFIFISGQPVKASEAVVSMFEIEGRS
jgi:predicted aspartyl protease